MLKQLNVKTIILVQCTNSLQKKMYYTKKCIILKNKNKNNNYSNYFIKMYCIEIF